MQLVTISDEDLDRLLEPLWAIVDELKALHEHMNKMAAQMDLIVAHIKVQMERESSGEVR